MGRLARGGGNDRRTDGLDSTQTAPPDEFARAALDVGLAETSDGTGSGAGGAARELSAGAAIGRFRVLGVLGSGGMGVVVAAHDPELDRKVAIKVLHADGAGSDGSGSGGRARLVREAQAMAKLQHPNVVAVYDVGTHGDEVFVAMEHVDGQNLRDWLAAEPRAHADILAVFAQAGRGLAAAHAEGLVHRDFKPANVLVRRDGRAQVTDFGLVGTSGQRVAGGPLTGDLALEASLTQTGMILGTPVYMAPEQHRCQALDARADQFAFCVALYEALYRHRPFAGDSYPEIAKHVLDGAVRAPPADAGVPPSMRAALLRGLSVEPGDRFDSMDELLDALEPPAPARATPRWGWAAAVAVPMLALAVYGVLRVGGDGAPVCPDPGARLRAAWDDDVKAAVRAGFEATGRGTAADVYARVEAQLDRYAAAWVAMRADACAATRVRGDQSQQLMDLRMACLDRRRDELAALTAVFADRPDGVVVDRAISAAYELPSVDGCGDAAALLAAFPPPDDPSTVAQVESIRRRLGEARAAEKAGRPVDALAIARALVDEARATGYPPVIAEVLYDVGKLQVVTADYVDAEPTLYEAAKVAAEAHDDRLVAMAWLDVFWSLDRQRRFDDAANLRPVVEAAVARTGDPVLRGTLENTLGAMAFRRRDFAAARAHYQAAVDQRTAALGPDHPDTAIALSNIGRVAFEEGNLVESDEYHARAFAIIERRYGAFHPEVARSLSARGFALLRRGDFAGAQAAFERSLGIAERVFGPDHLETARALGELGTVFGAQGLNERALPYFERAVAIEAKALGDHPDAAITLNNYGILLKNVGRFDDARAAHERALALRVKHYGADHVQAAKSYSSLGELANAAGDHAEARAQCGRALAINEGELGADAVWLAYDLVCVAEADLGLGEPARAVPLLERALALRGGGRASPLEIAETEFLLARALWDARGDRKRARALARAARDAYAAGGEGKQRETAAVDAWLAAH